MDPRCRKVFFRDVKGKGKKAEEEVVRLFIEGSKENALKTKPKGFDADHQDVELLRLRSFTLGAKIRDEDVLGKDGLEKVLAVMDGLVPWVSNFLPRHLFMLLGTNYSTC
jgi:uncharacterized protein (DUF2461 family)